jgi:cleavage and polyadenylation specificity factor subunit 6/7
MDGHYRFQHQGPVILRGGPGGMARPQMQIALGPRGPVSGGPMVLGRMPGPPPQQHMLVMQQSQRPGLPPNVNGPPLVRQPIRPGTSGEYNAQTSLFLLISPLIFLIGVPVSSSSMTGMPGQHPSNYYQGQPTSGQGVCIVYCSEYRHNDLIFQAPPHGLSISGQPHPDPYYRGVDAPASMVQISEAEFQEIMERNKTVSSSAIARAVQDASAGEYNYGFLSTYFLLN